VDLTQLTAFLRTTQPDSAEALDLDQGQPDAPQVPRPATGRSVQARRHRCSSQRRQARPINDSRSLLRHAIGSGNSARGRAVTPRIGSAITRQLRYSRDETQLALDLALFINVSRSPPSSSLKNSLDEADRCDAVRAVTSANRDPRRAALEFGRCIVQVVGGP